MRISIYYFSGTYNTFKVTETLKTELITLGAKVSMNDIADCNTFTPCDTLIIAYPVYGFNPPKNVIDFTNSLPNNCIPTYFIKTSGEPLRLNDASSLVIKKTLEKKGYKIHGEYHYVMPYNMIFKHSDELASKMLKTAIERTKIAASEIINHVYRPIQMPLRAKVMRKICTIEHKGMKINGRFYKVNMTKCVKCNLCLNNCPTKNISYNGEKFIFSKNCLGCARCAFHCPTDAISTGLLNFLKVNGKYNFNANADNAVLPKYCNKAYTRYFNVENKF